MQPIALADARIQTVSVFDIAEAVSGAIEETIPPGSEFDLVELEHHSLGEILAAHRNWLGLPAAQTEIKLAIVKHYVLTWPQRRADRNLIVKQVGFTVAQKPAADVDSTVARVE